MAKDAILELAKKLKDFPEQVENALITATKQAVNEVGKKMETNLKVGAQQTKAGKLLAEHQIEPARIISTNRVYSYQIDWENKPVNDKVDYPSKSADKKRLAGKRNYSVAPATWHDFAYILDEGRVQAFSETGVKVVAGTNFIKRARRNAKIWTKKRDIYAEAELELVAKNLDKE